MNAKKNAVQQSRKSRKNNSAKSRLATRVTKAARRVDAEENDKCECQCVHPAALAEVRKKIGDDLTLLRAAELFKTLADPTRLKIINALMISELCVCDIAELLAMSSPAVSHHLKNLRQAHLVKYRRDGKVVCYELDDRHVAELFAPALEHVGEK